MSHWCGFGEDATPVLMGWAFNSLVVCCCVLVSAQVLYCT